MTTLFEDDANESESELGGLGESELGESELDEISVSQPDASAAERSTRAQVILDEIGLIDLDIGQGIYTNAVEFVSDMQDRLEEARARKQELFCSERQLEWLEKIYEKVS